MKAFVINKPYDAGVYEVETPKPAPGEVLIRVKAAGFCGTDIHTFRGEHPAVYPIIPGHEFSGTVAGLGEGVSQFAVGDKVIADPNIFCENCPACKANHQIHCHNIKVIGNTRNGAFAEYVTVPQRCVFPADGIDLVQGSMAEPLACCINSHNKYDIRVGDRVLVLGAGTIGLMQLMLCKRRGASEVAVIDIKQSQLDMAAQLGADRVLLSDADVEQKLRDMHSDGFDVIIDATGVPAVVEMGIRLLAATGTFVSFGACAPDSAITVNPFDIYYKDLRIIGSYALQKTMGQAIATLKGGLDLERLIGQRISLDDMPRVFDDFVHGRTANKIIVTFDD